MYTTRVSVTILSDISVNPCINQSAPVPAEQAVVYSVSKNLPVKEFPCCVTLTI